MKLFKLFLIICSVALLSVACGSGGGGGGGDDEVCENAPDVNCGGNPMQVCCTSSQCKITVADKVFVCDSPTECDSAISDSVQYCKDLNSNSSQSVGTASFDDTVKTLQETIDTIK